MSFDALTNRGEYLSAHYLAEVLPTTLKTGLLKRWTEEEKAGRRTPRVGLRGLRRDYFDAKTELADAELFENDRLRKFHQEVLRALGFLTDASGAQQHTLTVERAGREYEISVAHAELGTGHGILAVDCGWAVDADAAQDPDDAGRLLDEVPLDAKETITSGPKLAVPCGAKAATSRSAWTPPSAATTTRNSTSSRRCSAPTRCAHPPREAPNRWPIWSPARVNTPWACPATYARDCGCRSS